MLDVQVLADHVATIAGQVPLRVTTKPGIDWAARLDALRARGVDLEVLHADDPARNLDDLRRSEAAHADREDRRLAWRRLAELDAESKALRALLPRLQRLVPGQGDVQDPRLLDVARIAHAEAAFWDAVLDATTARDEPAAPAPLPAAQAPRIAPAPADEARHVAAALNEARFRLGPRRWIVAHTAWDHVRTQCRAVAAHADTVAARTRDHGIAARYRELAVQCEGIARTLDTLLAR